jgi:hypothetical protein
MASLVLRVGTNVKCIPTHVREFDCRLDARVEGVCISDLDHSDPLIYHQIDIVLKTSSELRGGPYLQSWHFDRHEDGGGAAPPVAAHPRYHFSFGGREVERHLKACSKPYFDGLLILDSPRLSHAPFDAVLAIDFVLSNFAANTWRIFRTSADYNRIVRNAQLRLWRPYAKALNAHWESQPLPKTYWPIDKIWPSVLTI